MHSPRRGNLPCGWRRDDAELERLGGSRADCERRGAGAGRRLGGGQPGLAGRVPASWRGVDRRRRRWTVGAPPHTAERVPWFDGAKLDLVVDYATYVLVPALVLVGSGLLSQPWAMLAGIVVAMVGALYLADDGMKTDDAAFRGFPAVWNAVVLQLMVYKLPEPLTLLIVVAFAVLTFTPVEFVHPIRVRRWRPLTLAMTVAWGLLALACVLTDLSPGPMAVTAFALVSLYFALVGVVLQLTRG
jgi:phosphatidylcholine synthase